MQGINPEKQSYTLSGIPGRTFSGFHRLAYYHVSWAVAILDMLEGLQLPYNQEYEVAIRMAIR